ncbi:MAG: two pore domain potassium channel family protein [Muribaculaceae bacterium]|nr:two pore domain potassium channel family protein [Muribaculaceae bacterium]
MKLDDTSRRRIRSWLHAVVLVLSLALILFISYDTFTHRPFLNNHVYMTFQFWVCVVFILDFFIQLYIAENRWKFFRRYLLFLLISIPYLNIITHTGMVLTNQQLYLVRFIPLVRAAAALAIVISFVSKNKITGMFATYISIMVLVVYFASLIFLQREQGVNPDITGYWTSLWWCCLETTTIGAPINPVTPTGKILAFVLSGMGMIMFPLFTVYLTELVRKYMKAKAKPSSSTQS